MQRKAILRGASLLLLSLAYGCNAIPVASAPGPLVTQPSHDGTISTDQIGMPVINPSGLISNNAGGLAGTIKGPSAALISNNAGGLISNNAGGLISNNAGGLISNNAGGYRVLNLESGTAPVADARVAVFDERGEMVSAAWTSTDKNGNYTFKQLKPSGPLLIVKALYTVGDRQITLMSVAAAPREAGIVSVNVTPATTLVAKKVSEMLRQRVVDATNFKPETAVQMAEKVAPVMSDKAIFLAAFLPNNEAAKTFDNMLKESPSLKTALNTVAASSPAVLSETKVDAAPSGTGSNGGTGGGSEGNGDTGSGSESEGTGGGTGSSGGTSAPAPTATVSTLLTLASGSVQGLDGATGSDTFYLPNGGSPKIGQATSTTAANVTDDSATGAIKAVAMGTDGRYFLTDAEIIKPDGSTVTITGGTTFADFAVVGTNAYITSSTNDCVYQVPLSGSTGAAVVFAGQDRNPGFANGTGTQAKFQDPLGITYDGTDLIVADSSNLRIRRLTLAGAVTTLAGSGSPSAVDGSSTAAGFMRPVDVTTDGQGNLFVADNGAHRVRWINSSGTVKTIAGNGNLASTDGVGASASIAFPCALSYGKIGTTPVLFVAEEAHKKVRVVSNW